MVWFLDSQVNANFEDFNNYSSIISTTVAGTTFSTSSRLGYRWLNGDRSWMYGINAGYDTRPMATGYADTGVSVTNKNTVFYQQAAVNLEAVSNSKSLSAYALLPTGTKQYQINSVYQAGALNTYGFDAGYNITPELTASVGYYYQQGDFGSADGSGVKGRLAIDVTKNIEFGETYTYDDAFESRASADLTIRFGGNHKEKSKEQTKAEEQPQIKQLSATPMYRDVRVHDERYTLQCGVSYDGTKNFSPIAFKSPVMDTEDATFLSKSVRFGNACDAYGGYVKWALTDPETTLQRQPKKTK